MPGRGSGTSLSPPGPSRSPPPGLCLRAASSAVSPLRTRCERGPVETGLWKEEEEEEEEEGDPQLTPPTNPQGDRWGLLWRPTWRPSMKAIVRMMRTFRTESRERQRLERPILMMMGRRGKRG